MENIPSRFTIFGETYKVKQLVKIDKKDSWGEHDPNKNIIKVKKGLNPEQKAQSFYHELTHCILHHLSYHTLDTNEVFVDQFSKALHQVLSTKE